MDHHQPTNWALVGMWSLNVINSCQFTNYPVIWALAIPSFPPSPNALITSQSIYSSSATYLPACRLHSCLLFELLLVQLWILFCLFPVCFSALSGTFSWPSGTSCSHSPPRPPHNEVLKGHALPNVPVPLLFCPTLKVKQLRVSLDQCLPSKGNIQLLFRNH